MRGGGGDEVNARAYRSRGGRQATGQREQS